MARAIWNGTVIAESDQTQIVEGNHYFPSEAVAAEHIRPSTHHTVCSWKGTASYYDVVVGSEVNENAAWFYPQPSDAAADLKDYVAFWNGVAIEA